MECEDRTEDGPDGIASMPRRRGSRVAQGGRALAAGARRGAAAAPRGLLAPGPPGAPHAPHTPHTPHTPRPPPNTLARPHVPTVPSVPFMNNMDEIVYWIHTKRAPCLMNYDNLFKKQSDEAHCSKSKSVHSTPERVPVAKKKKKRKLTILDDDSVVTEKQQNVYFEVSQHQNQRTHLSSCKSDTVDSDIDFNIKNYSIQDKPKRIKLQRNSRTTLHKKNRVITSTPKVTTNLRRSLRKLHTQTSANNKSQANTSFELLSSNVVNGNIKESVSIPTKLEQQKSIVKSKKSLEKLASGDQSVDNKNNMVVAVKPKNETMLNGQFEDLSDVSGFTANYIRSTKIQSTKTSKKIRNKVSRNLVKESKSANREEDSMLMCVNKSVNTGLTKATALNCSTDSSQNIVNLVTMENNAKPVRISRSTSLLKFMDTKIDKSKDSLSKSKLDNSEQTSKTNLNISCKSKSSTTSRYPKRYKNSSTEDVILVTSEKSTDRGSADKRRKVSKNSSEFNNSDRKENPEEKSVYRTRTGRRTGLTIRQPENSVLVLSISTEHVSSAGTMNVASPANADKLTNNLKKKKHVAFKSIGRVKKSMDKNDSSLKRYSLRDKSGFSACFSDSDDDKPLKPQKFFC